MPGLTNVTAIDAFGDGVYALRGDGTVWYWGSGVADYTIEPFEIPRRITGFDDVTAIAAGGTLVAGLTSDGTVQTIGRAADGWGILGNGTYDSSATPVSVSDLTDVTAIAIGTATGYALRTDGTVWSWGAMIDGGPGYEYASNRGLAPNQILGLRNVSSIAGSNFGAVAVIA